MAKSKEKKKKNGIHVQSPLRPYGTVPDKGRFSSDFWIIFFNLDLDFIYLDLRYGK
jgi:hypothetical protein